MKDLNQILLMLINDPHASAAHPISIFNKAPGQSSPEETAATIEMISKIKYADKELLTDVLNYCRKEKNRK